MSGSANAGAVVEPVADFPKSTAGSWSEVEEVGPPKCECEMNQTREQTRSITPRNKKEPEIELGAGIHTG